MKIPALVGVGFDYKDLRRRLAFGPDEQKGAETIFERKKPFSTIELPKIARPFC